tara:strand:+ start:460 stop:630 length:171 start_codon:yes stop_codon:yes gene_type:complete
MSKGNKPVYSEYGYKPSREGYQPSGKRGSKPSSNETNSSLPKAPKGGSGQSSSKGK